MLLHNDSASFIKAVTETAAMLGVEPALVEKDYFVTLLLREISTRQPDAIFKGGTSLSKAHHAIKRFSEDIDLNLLCETGKPSEGRRRTMKTNIIDAISSLGLVLENEGDIRSRRDFNQYIINYPAVFHDPTLKDKLIVETAYFLRAYPVVTLPIQAYIAPYVANVGGETLASELGLLPFTMSVQSIERTFIDKVFALCDYYLAGKIENHSRHIYDIFQLLPRISFDDDLKSLAAAVRAERANRPTVCLSAVPDIDIPSLLETIVESNAYRNDYENRTTHLLFEPISYDMAIQAFHVILANNIF